MTLTIPTTARVELDMGFDTASDDDALEQFSGWLDEYVGYTIAEAPGGLEVTLVALAGPGGGNPCFAVSGPFLAVLDVVGYYVDEVPTPSEALEYLAEFGTFE